MKVLSVVGTRPEIIRLSLILKKLDKFFDHIHVNTGQNFISELNLNFYKELDLRKPDYSLGNGLKQISIGEIIDKTNEIILKEKPDAFICLGDTNSALAAYSAKRNQVPIFHLEAGNRCFDQRVPEEINRKIVDNLADINLCYSSNARIHLLSEGFKPDRIFLTGSPLPEVIKFYENNIHAPTSNKLSKVIQNEFLLISLHRHEILNNDEKLKTFVNTINKLSKEYAIVMTCHPKFEDALSRFKLKVNPKNVISSKPFSYFEYLYLLKKAKYVLSDSGTITEESSVMELPALSLRYTNERQEGFDHGLCPMVGVDLDSILLGMKILKSRNMNFYKEEKIHDYRFHNTSDTIISIISSYTQYIKRNIYYEKI